MQKQSMFDVARDRMVTTCGRLWKSGIAIGAVGFLAGILLSKILGWPIYGLFVGAGVALGALLARSFLQAMTARQGEEGDGEAALRRAITRSLVFVVIWCAAAGIFDVLDEKFDIDPGHVHIFWVVSIGGALANLWLVIVSALRIWNPLSVSAR